LKQKKLQKDEILGAFAPKITSFYTTIGIFQEIKTFFKIDQEVEKAPGALGG
jgi:hypothetical protein